LAALRYVLEQVGEIAFLAAAMRPEHAAAMQRSLVIRPPWGRRSSIVRRPF
jgi:hypothetical protein